MNGETDSLGHSTRFAQSISGRTATALGFLALSLAVIAAYATTSQQIFNPDPCVYGECARQLLAGGTLYADVWQDKPPLAIIGYAVPQLVAPGSYMGIQVFLGLILILLSAIAAMLCRTRSGAWLATAIIILLPLSHHDLYWASTEHFANVFILLVLVLAWRDRIDRAPPAWFAFAAGAAVACAFHTRQTTLPVGLFYVAVLLSSHPDTKIRLKRLTIFVLGGLTAWMAVIVVILALGDFRGYIDTVFLYPLRYGSNGSWGTAGRLILESAGTPLPFVAALLLAATWRSSHRMIALGGVGTGLLMCLLPQRDYIHYLVSLIPFVVMLVWIAESDARAARATLRAMAIAVTVAGLGSAALSLTRVKESPSRIWMDDVVARVETEASQDATIWATGLTVATYIQFASDLPPVHTVFAPFQLDPPIINSLPEPPDRIMAQYLSNPPTVLVVYDQALESVVVPDRQPDPGSVRNSRELLGALLAGGNYVSRGSINGFSLFVLVEEN